MVQTDTGDQGIDVRKEQEKIVAYFEKDPTLTISVVPDENQQELYVLAERLQDYTKVYSYRDVETFIAQNHGMRSFQEFETLYRPIEEEDEIEEIENTNLLIQEDDEMIIEEKVAINKSKKKRKEKAQGFEMT
ncbi:hypothetical protein NGF69_16535 [Enterococcus casseliflavus]|nr:hypothetical protein [Enterococcus casseliflavus]